MNKNVPIIFTHHTRYEDYTHYVPFDSEGLKEVAINLPTQFANLCDGVVAPSESIARLLHRRGVKTPMAVIPTGIDVVAFASADGRAFRRKFNIPPDAVVIGHCGRLAEEKNLGHLAEAVALFLEQEPLARFLVVGDGPWRENLTAIFQQKGVADRLILAGKRTGRVLREAYRAMDVFAFASLSETQGMVVAEAMAAGRPVVALNAPGVREVVRDEENGYLLPTKSTPAEFTDALRRVAGDKALREKFGGGASETAKLFSREHCAGRMIAFYEETRRATRRRRLFNDLHPWAALVQRLGLEWDLLAAKTQTIVEAIGAGR
jgi:1,2-diacylglycerol 3-alpha-glucosyltransferase